MLINCSPHERLNTTPSLTEVIEAVIVSADDVFVFLV